MKVELDAEVIAGAWLTLIVRLWVALVPTPLAAVIETVAEPEADGVPEMVAVPFALSWKLSPAGSVPDSVIDADGDPVVVIEKLFGVPTVKVELDAEVIAGA